MKKYALKTLLSVLTITGSLLAGSPAKGQTSNDSLKRNAVYIELLGQGVLYSVNYDYRIKENIALRAGLTTYGINFFSKSNVTGFPMMLNYLSGKRKGHFEAGIGFMPLLVTEETGWFSWEDDKKKQSEVDVIGNINLGYRYQPRTGGFVFRFNFTPLIGPTVIPWAGMSFGYGF